jgi:hypothetical protein
LGGRAANIARADPGELPRLLELHLAPRRRRRPQDGTQHCVISRPNFYTLSTNGVSFVSWLDALLNDDAPPAPVAPSSEELPS